MLRRSRSHRSHVSRQVDLHFHFAIRCCNPLTRAIAKLLGPCFKTGRRGGRLSHREHALAALTNTSKHTTQMASHSRCSLRALANSVHEHVFADQRVHQLPHATGYHSKVDHATQIRRTHRTSQRILTAKARRQALTQTPRNRPNYRLTQRGAPNNTDHCQLYQLSPFRPLWFHVLLNSLFKVLFNFPSQYLFAIGFEMIFSLGCGIPPTLSCISKQLDSKTPPTKAITIRTGLTPSLEEAFQQTSDSNHSRQQRLYATPPIRSQPQGLCAGLIRFHSPLLTESLLVSFPPLTDMLKFSG